MTTSTPLPEQKDEQIIELLKDFNGYDFCGEKACSSQAKASELIKYLKALISDQVTKAVDKTLTDLEDFKQEVLESRGIPNPTYVGKNELQEWIDNRRATLNGVKE